MTHKSFSSHINQVDRAHVKEVIAKHSNEEKCFLDVGGRNGERKDWSANCQYVLLDIQKADGVDIVADICCCPEIPDQSFDIVFSMNVLEHVDRPWDAALEMVRITKLGGLIVQLAPFSWRYHPHPVDHWRFSHTGLERLFAISRKVDTLVSGYDYSRRRNDSRGNMKDKLDVPPIDHLGGWRENWHSVWIGTKR